MGGTRWQGGNSGPTQIDKRLVYADGYVQSHAAVVMTRQALGRLLLGVVVLLFVLGACNGGQHGSSVSGSADAGVDALSADEIDQIFDRALTLMEKSGAIIERDSGDCPAMGHELEALREKNVELIHEIQHVYGSSPPERRSEYNHRYHDRYHAAWAKIRPGLLKCKNVPEVNKVVHELAGG